MRRTLLTLLLLTIPSLVQAQYRVQDTFTDTAGDSLITQHTANTGQSWAAVTGGIWRVSNANRVYPGSAGTGHDSILNEAPAGTAYVVAIDIIPMTHSGDFSDSPRLLGRWSDIVSSGYLAYNNGGTWVLGVYDDASVFTYLGDCSGAVVDTTTYHLEMRVLTGLTQLFVDGALCTSSINTTITRAGYGGIGTGYQNSASSNTTGWHVDNFTLRDVIAYDTYTTGTPSLLTSHTGEVGASYNKVAGSTGDWMDATDIYPSSAGTAHDTYASGEPSSNLYSVEADFVVMTKTGSLETTPRLWGRLLPTAQTGYFAYNTGNTWILYRFDAGFGADYMGDCSGDGSPGNPGAIAEGQTYHVVLELYATKRLLVNGDVCATSATDVHTAIGRGGMGTGYYETAATIDTGTHLDNFLVIGVGAVGGPPPVTPGTSRWPWFSGGISR